MKRAQCVSWIFAFVTFASTATAQVIPTAEDRQAVALVEKLFVGASVAITAEIANLRGQLAQCDGPANRRPDTCSARTLLQAKLNYLLKIGMALGDPDIAGAPPVPLTRPTDTFDYEGTSSYLREQIRNEGPDIIYGVSENRAKFTIIGHCKAMKDLYYLSAAFLTSAETMALNGAAAAAKTKADVNACINDFDAKAISANRKAAVEYCFQSSNYTADSFAGPRFDACMNKHDMMQAMCKRQLELQEAYSRRKNPAQQHAPQTCPALRLSPREIQAIQASPAARTMAELPPKFFAPPDVVIPPRPPLPIPSGTVLETKLQGGLDGFKVEVGTFTQSILDEPLVVSGQTVIPAHSGVILKTRIVGPGTRPNTVQIGLTTEEVQLSAGKFADLKSNELVFTVPNQATALDPGIVFDTKLRFTIGGTGAVVTPPAQPAPAQPVPAPPRAAAPPPAPTTAGSGTPDPQQQAEELRKKGERIQVCMLQAMKDKQGSPGLAQALAACAQTK